MVPTRDRAERLPVLLEALAAQTLARDRYEVVAVDDGSADDTPRVLAAADVDRVVRHERSRGPAAARNSGWRAASAPLVAFTDDDCRPEPGW
ncbi:MAG: mycofactocin glycosyltransferase, partial [Thermoleophilaceae bacterium]|nr:mycofactocin glycosyltransferase [Thermoleophilaceae bacterium]